MAFGNVNDQVYSRKDFALTASAHTATNEPLETVSLVPVTSDLTVMRGAAGANMS